jgi:hypothetical protein
MDEPDSRVITPHMVRVYSTFRAHPGEWLTNDDLAHCLDGIARRTVRAHTRWLAQLQLVDKTAVLGGYRYRWSVETDARNPTYVDRLLKASQMFGITATRPSS